MTNGSGQAWQVLRDLPSWQVTQIPRRPHGQPGSSPGQDRADLGSAQRLQALVSAFHYGAPVAFGWIREQAGGPVRVLAAGPALAGAAEGGQVVLTLPAGGRAQPLAPGHAFGIEARLRDCALSHAVDDAVAARIPAIASRVSGPALAVHITAAMHAALGEGRWLCDTHEPQWLAPSYQWALVLDSLRARLRREPGSGPHPRTAEWEAAYSRAIDGPDWEQRLADALTAFRDCRWPLDLLRPAPPGAER